MSFASFTSEGGQNYFDGLVASEHPRIIRKGTLISGQNLARGAAIGVITTSGKYKLSASADSDGSQVIDAILLAPCDASAGEKECIYALTGEFIGAAIVLGAGHTLAAARTALRTRGIFLT